MAKHIELFLVDGTPGGLTTAEILNWTGQVLSAPRSEMSALVSRTELAGTCVYLLLGPTRAAARGATSVRPTTSRHGFVITTPIESSGGASL